MLPTFVLIDCNLLRHNESYTVSVLLQRRFGCPFGAINVGGTSVFSLLFLAFHSVSHAYSKLTSTLTHILALSIHHRSSL